MALTACKECKKEVSTRAQVCPYCGVKNPGVKAKEVLAGLVVLIVAGGIVASCMSGKSSDKAIGEGKSTDSAIGSAASAAMAQMPATFSGLPSAPAAENWPKVAEIDLPRSADEKLYLDGGRCFDESECYGAKRFRKYIFKRFPDLARVSYRASKEEASDRELVENRKESFFQGLYFAKQIQLANGQSLYDFMRLCARGFTAMDGAEWAWDLADPNKGAYFDIQYFPTLKRIDTGELVELQILLERRGDKLVARSPFFSTNALRYPDFLQRHNVTCWNGRAPQPSLSKGEAA